MTFFKKVLPAFGALVAGALLMLTACNKSTDTSSDVDDNVSIYLSDDPGMYDNVFVDIRYVEVKIQDGHKNEDHVGSSDDDDADDHFDDNDLDGDDDHTSGDQYGKWDTLAIRSGVYDVLKLRNGIDTLFAKGTVKGRVRKVRLTLGDKNSIVVAGVSSPLILHPTINNYVYVRVHNRHHDRINTHHIAFWIDFDIANSILELNGHYYLRPFLKPFCENLFGRVSGKIIPAGSHAWVRLVSIKDAGSAIANQSGEYKVRGLLQGTYKAVFRGINGFSDTTITDIKVERGKETTLPDVTLHK